MYLRGELNFSSVGYSRLAMRPATQGQSPTCGSRSQSLSSREASVCSAWYSTWLGVGLLEG